MVKHAPIKLIGIPAPLCVFGMESCRLCVVSREHLKRTGKLRSEPLTVETGMHTLGNTGKYIGRGIIYLIFITGPCRLR